MSDHRVPPELFGQLAPLWVFIISAIGALVGYLEDFKHEDTTAVKVAKALTRLSSSAFAAVLTYHAVGALDISEKWWVPIVGISGHMGVEALKFGGEILRGWATRRANPETKP